MQPYRRTDTRGPAPVRVRVPGSAAPDRVRAWAFAPGGGPCRASTRATRRTAGKRTPPPARARPSADGPARSGAGERRGLDAAGSSWAAPGAGRPRSWWRRPRDPPPGPRRPDVYPGHKAGPRHQGATSRRRRQPRPGHGPDRARPGQDQPRTRAPAHRARFTPQAAPDGGQGGQARPEPGQSQAGPGQRPAHGVPQTAASFATGGERRHRGQGPARLGQSRITNITSTRATRRKSSRISRLRQWWGGVKFT